MARTRHRDIGVARKNCVRTREGRGVRVEIGRLSNRYRFAPRYSFIDITSLRIVV
jgi:hypothetical protein